MLIFWVPGFLLGKMALLHGSPSIYSNSTCISTYMYTRFRPQNKQKQIKSNGIQTFKTTLTTAGLEKKHHHSVRFGPHESKISMGPEPNPGPPKVL